jgi:iron-sulfur cluster assembly protein
MARARPKVVTLTDAAAARVKAIMSASHKPYLRVGVKNGGCAGMSYTVEMAEDQRPGELLVEDKGAKVLIDPKAVLFLIGAQMDFETTKFASTFTFKNPNETSACGCGESVAITPVSEENLKEFT